MKLLITTDGSDAALAAVRWIVRTAPEWRSLDVHLVTVQPPIPGAALVGAEAVKGYHRAEGEAALKEARTLLDQAGVRYECHILVGDVADAIVAYARDHGCDQILMSTRGKGVFETLLLGSTTTRVLELAAVPVTVVK